jgi:voltage-gated potassium channel Kch
MVARSYFGLIVNFAMIDFLLTDVSKFFVRQFPFLSPFVPIDCLFDKSIGSFFDSLYFSVMTIATVGYGDIAPTRWTSRIFAIEEILSGILLLGVAFTIYVGAPKIARKPQSVR